VPRCVFFYQCAPTHTTRAGAPCPIAASAGFHSLDLPSTPPSPVFCPLRRGSAISLYCFRQRRGVGRPAYRRGLALLRRCWVFTECTRRQTARQHTPTCRCSHTASHHGRRTGLKGLHGSGCFLCSVARPSVSPLAVLQHVALWRRRRAPGAILSCTKVRWVRLSLLLVGLLNWLFCFVFCFFSSHDSSLFPVHFAESRRGTALRESLFRDGERERARGTHATGAALAAAPCESIHKIQLYQGTFQEATGR